MANKNSKKYARALFNVVELNDIEGAISQLSLLKRATDKDREIMAAISSPLFNADEKVRAVEVIAGALKFSPDVTKYLKYVVSDGMAPLLSEIINKAVVINNEKKKKAKATVLSAVEISDDMRKRLKDSLGAMTSKDVDIEYVNDPSLLGGFIVKVGSTMYDSSLKGQLRLLKDELVKG
ncbi:MAG: ATP synthase F1 subunit delta [Nitrospirota bacterium]|nr:MAG: ATP synthase F1 subunit delta [Nitrospirota bacterium]